jgi:hypothetical protein
MMMYVYLKAYREALLDFEVVEKIERIERELS